MTKHSWSGVLLYIAKNTSLFDTVKTSTSRISQEVGLSQQSISRVLRDMEKEGLITRQVRIDGQEISITDKGIKILESQYLDLKKIFERKTRTIIGIVKPGLGEGGYYVGLKGYRKQFNEKLGFVPFAGTLNLQVKGSEARSILNKPDIILIDGFNTKKRSYGSLKAYKIKIDSKIHGAIVVPARTNHGAEILEIIAPVGLRAKLHLKDNSPLKITVD